MLDAALRIAFGLGKQYEVLRSSAKPDDRAWGHAMKQQLAALTTSLPAEVRRLVNLRRTHESEPTTVERSAPERIWLQIDPQGDMADVELPFPCKSDVTWCDSSVGGLEVAYVRSDLVRAVAGDALAIARDRGEWEQALYAAMAAAPQTR